jgi:hypothetical protein
MLTTLPLENGIASSNPAQGMDIHVSVLLCCVVRRWVGTS